MVSGINSIRLWSSQAALNAFKDTADTATSTSRLSAGGSAGASLADILYSSNDDDDSDYEDTQLEAMIAQLQQAMNGSKTDDTDTDDGDAGDMSSKAFMKALRQKLEGLQDNPDTKDMADKMLAALDAGTLTVTDAVNGEQVKAWDVTDSKQLSAAKTEVDKDDWSSYLKDILTRDQNGKFVRAKDGSYIEKNGGASGFFGMVGEAYYYLSWTTPAATSGSGTSGNATSSSSGSSTK